MRAPAIREGLCGSGTATRAPRPSSWGSSAGGKGARGATPQVSSFILSAVDVTITIFYDFRQFSAKNGVCLINQRYDQNFTKTRSSVSKKVYFFA
jgi:hypothetical protein